MGFITEQESDFRKSGRLSTGLEATISLTMGGVSANIWASNQTLLDTNTKPDVMFFVHHFQIQMKQHHKRVVLFVDQIASQDPTS